MSPKNLRKMITEILKRYNLYSEKAVELLMLTAAVESNYGYWMFQNKGPALGVFQMEPATEEDIWDNYLEYKPELRSNIRSSLIKEGLLENYNLTYNLVYQILMARVHYLRVKEPIPEFENSWNDYVYRLAEYWKKYYNTPLGKGTVEKAVRAYKDRGL